MSASNLLDGALHKGKTDETSCVGRGQVCNMRMAGSKHLWKRVWLSVLFYGNCASVCICENEDEFIDRWENEIQLKKTPDDQMVLFL